MINLQHLVEINIRTDGSYGVVLIHDKEDDYAVDPAYAQPLLDAINKINKQYN